MGAAPRGKQEAEGNLRNHRKEGDRIAQENGAAHQRRRVDLGPLARFACAPRRRKSSQKEQEKEEG